MTWLLNEEVKGYNTMTDTAVEGRPRQVAFRAESEFTSLKGSKFFTWHKCNVCTSVWLQRVCVCVLMLISKVLPIFRGLKRVLAVFKVAVTINCKRNAHLIVSQAKTCLYKGHIITWHACWYTLTNMFLSFFFFRFNPFSLVAIEAKTFGTTPGVVLYFIMSFF